MKNYRTLDAIVVIASLAMLAGAGYALVFIRIPEANLPILSALITGSVAGTLGLYAGARWGNKKSDEPHPPTAGGDVSLTLQASGVAATAESDDTAA